jgi:cobalt-zinc-cadmium efflux system outer membrane protein
VKRTWIVQLIGMAVAVGAWAQAPAPVNGGPPEELKLSRERAVEIALAENPAIAAAREQVEQARARVVEAGALPDAALATTLEEEQSFLRPRTATSKDIGLAVTIPFPEKLRLSANIARAALRAAELSVVQVQQQLSAQTSQAYDAYLVALRHKVDLEEAKGLSRDFLDKTEARYQGGTVAKLDVVRARVDAAQAENDLIANERAIATARAALNRLLARPLGAPLEATDALAVPPSLPDVEELERLALASRPEIKGLAVTRDGARLATTLARRYWLPDLSVTLSRNFTAGDPPAFSTAAAITIPLFFWQHQRGTIAEARHREAELSADAVDLAAQVGLDVRTAYATAATAARQAAYLRDEVLPEARQAFHIASVSYGLGGSSALDFLDAKRTLLAAVGEYTDALGTANDARADLERAVGAPLAEGNGATHDQ